MSGTHTNTATVESVGRTPREPGAAHVHVHCITRHFTIPTHTLHEHSVVRGVHKHRHATGAPVHSETRTQPSSYWHNNTESITYNSTSVTCPTSQSMQFFWNTSRSGDAQWMIALLVLLLASFLCGLRAVAKRRGTRKSSDTTRPRNLQGPPTGGGTMMHQGQVSAREDPTQHEVVNSPSLKPALQHSWSVIELSVPRLTQHYLYQKGSQAVTTNLRLRTGKNSGTASALNTANSFVK